MAMHNPDSYIACLANDGKGAADRLYQPIYKNFRLHRLINGPFSKVVPNKLEVILPNHTKIEAIPCDAAGEAGSQPIGTFWSEVWGFTSEAKMRLWTELTIPPTLEGYAIRWVESYAGIRGVSTLLEQLYETAVTGGTQHPDFPDLPVYTNETAGTFCYWDHEPRMIWQTPAYYQQQQQMLTPSEYLRVHRNEWVASLGQFVQEDWWKGLEKKLPPLDSRTPVVLGVDGGLKSDYASIVGVTRDPDNSDDVVVRFCYIFTPKGQGGTIKIMDTLKPLLESLKERYNVVCVSYDPYQLEAMAQDLSSKMWMDGFNQQTKRALADKFLYDSILNRRIWWDSNGIGLPFMGDNPSLYKHVIQAGAKTEGNKLRLEKLSPNIKIDAAVALSMANYRCKELNLGGSSAQMPMEQKIKTGRLTEAEVLQRMRVSGR
jgi:hypothetical protein